MELSRWAACTILGAIAMGCGTSRPSSSAGAEVPSRQVEPLASSPAESTPAVSRDPRRSPLGTNLDHAVDWSPEIPFVDLFRTSRPWTSAPAWGEQDDRQPIDVDEAGWVRSLRPSQIVRTGMLWDQTTAPAGRYVVLYRGRGEIRYFGGAAEHVVERSPGRDVLDWNPGRDGAGLGLGIVRTDPADPIRDIRVLLPGGVCSSDQTRWCDASNPCSEGECRGFEASHEAQIFNPKFLAQLGRYGLVRFMNWQGTNASQARTWEERKRVSDARWSEGDGVPLEIVAELANRIGVDAWICIPHRADDRYVVEAGRLMHRLLAPERRVWLEYSNESWNSIFESWRYTRDEGLRLGLGGPEQDHTFAQIRFQARRSVEVFRKFSEGFPDRARVTRVLASHAPNDWISDQMLSWSGTASETDALAIAPYFGVLVNPSNRAEFLARDADETMRLAASELVPEAIGWMRAQKAVASRHHVELVAYEAGQHYVGVSGLEHDAELNRRLDALDRHPAWESVYTSYLDGWKSAGGGMMAHFLHCARPDGHGRFGLKHWLDEPDARSPRLRAVDAFIARTPRWW